MALWPERAMICVIFFHIIFFFHHFPLRSLPLNFQRMILLRFYREVDKISTNIDVYNGLALDSHYSAVLWSQEFLANICRFVGAKQTTPRHSSVEFAYPRCWLVRYSTFFLFACLLSFFFFLLKRRRSRMTQNRITLHIFFSKITTIIIIIMWFWWCKANVVWPNKKLPLRRVTLTIKKKIYLCHMTSGRCANWSYCW